MRVSVVIPALNEEATLPAMLTDLARQSPHQIIVVDGGSRDATGVVAAAGGATVLTASRGRAVQMNAGANAATGDVLVFLHADCTLEAGALPEIPRVLGRPGVVAGCFRMAFSGRQAPYRSIAWCATARVRLFDIAYGDQGIFLRRELFERIGGFPTFDLMEDVWFSLRLRKLGRFGVADSRILVSPRRWKKKGVVSQTLRNWALTAIAAAGVHPNRLARFYPHVR